MALPVRLAPLLLTAFLMGGCDAGDTPEDSVGDPDISGQPAVPSEAGGSVMSITPSFDCSAPASSAEVLVCSEAELASLDLTLDSAFEAAMRVIAEMPDPQEAATLRATQRGWVKGRDDCWKADDLRECVASNYRERTVELQARFNLVEAGEPEFWSCEGNAANEFVTTQMATNPVSLRVERGDQMEVAVLRTSQSGSRYEAPFDRHFTILGDEAVVVWPQGTQLECIRRN